MNNHLKKQEKGSVLIEVIAVVALLGVMGPLLFKQVADRNEEVENINIASEMRIMKEAFSSYLMSYHSEITCTEKVCTPDLNTIASYLPSGFEGTMNGYHFSIIKDSSKKGNSSLQGFIIPDLTTLNLEGLSLKRVARIATLIGADGGILRKGNDEINGTGAAWQLEKSKLTDAGILFSDDDHTFIATTGIDTYVPTVKYEDFDQSNILMPDMGYASKRLHAWNLFSVGQVDSSADNSCFELKHNSTTSSDTSTATTAQNDTIRLPGEKGCDPLFWVAAEGDYAGNVFVKNQLHMRSSPTANTSVIIASEPLGESDKRPTSVLIEGTQNKPASASIEENKKRRIVVYTANGKEAITINGQGEIIARGVSVLSSSETMSEKDNETETLTLKNGRIESNAKAANASKAVGSNQAYKVDPRFISVMGDIRLESRGGAKLSELLPKYQLKEISTITNLEFNTSTGQTIAMPACPHLHVPAIVVTPVQWHQSTEKNMVDAVVNSVKAKEDGTLEEKAEVIPNTYPILPRVEIKYDTDIKNYHHTAGSNPNTGGAWIVNLSYDQNGTEITDITTPITALVHTYCVYTGDSGDAYVTDRPNDESSVVGN